MSTKLHKRTKDLDWWSTRRKQVQEEMVALGLTTKSLWGFEQDCTGTESLAIFDQTVRAGRDADNPYSLDLQILSANYM